MKWSEKTLGLGLGSFFPAILSYPEMDPEYKIGALGDFLSGRGDGSKEVSDLFSTSRKQKAASPPRAKRKLAKEEEKKDISPKKKPKVANNDDKDDGEEAEEGKPTRPSLRQLVRQEDAKQRRDEPQLDKRTIFVGNLPVKTKEKQLRRIFGEFGSVETVRFRGAARPDLKTTKKTAIIKREIHENRHNICAYVRFASEGEARAAAAAKNGFAIDENVVRVDMAAPERKRDQRLALFVGNLSYAVEENEVRKHFKKCGDISDVRIVRDSSTGIGKGFGYVNFGSEDSVEIGLRLDGSDLAGRRIRVSRCVRKVKVNAPAAAARPKKKKNLKTNKMRQNEAPKKTTRRKVKEMKATEFQGQSFDKSSKGKRKPKVSKEDKKKKILSQKLQK